MNESAQWSPPAEPLSEAESRALRAGKRTHVVIQPRSGWKWIDLRELWLFRDLLLILAGRDLKLRYKQTLLGVTWVVLQPLIAAAIFAFVFGRVARLEPPGGVPYFLFALTGMVAWGAFSVTLMSSSNSTVLNAQLVSKVYFPRLLLPMSPALSALVDLVVMLGVLVVLLLFSWHLPGWNLIWLPVSLGLLLMLALGVGFLCAALSVFYRDVKYILPVGVQFLLYASPVAYPVELVPPEYLSIYLLNPLASLLEVFRWSLLGTGKPPWGHFAYAAALSGLAFAAGAHLFGRLEGRFADAI